MGKKEKRRYLTQNVDGFYLLYSPGHSLRHDHARSGCCQVSYCTLHALLKNSYKNIKYYYLLLDIIMMMMMMLLYYLLLLCNFLY